MFFLFLTFSFAWSARPPSRLSIKSRTWVNANKEGVAGAKPLLNKSLCQSQVPRHILIALAMHDDVVLDTNTTKLAEGIDFVPVDVFALLCCF